jgi:Protein of unknown function (DUF433)
MVADRKAKTRRPRSRAVLRSGARGASMELFPGISMDPKIRFGKPCLAVTRMDVATILAGTRIRFFARRDCIRVPADTRTDLRRSSVRRVQNHVDLGPKQVLN